MAASYSISEAARRLRTSPRMLRYREAVGLLPARRGAGGSHRRYDETDLSVAAAAIELERRYDVSPATLAFAVRVLTEPRLQGHVRELASRSGRGGPALAALDFEQQKALRLLDGRPPGDPSARARR